MQLAGLELVFGDGVNLTEVSRNGDFAGQHSVELSVPSLAPDAYIGFPGLAHEYDDVFSADGALSVSVDRERHLVRMRINEPERWWTLADNVMIGVDAEDFAAAFLSANVQWTDA